ncbi:MAG: ABC transporter ATP-binding protein/permease [Anaerolineae bacterium]|nr:ABC transporter ATP-binding protein/permease [Anaerolineae bacterium]
MSPPRDPPSDSQGTAQILVRCYRYLSAYWQLAGGAYLLLFVITGLALLIPRLVGWIVDRGMRAGDTEFMGTGVLALLGLTLLKGILSYWQGRWTEMASQGVAYDLRNAIHEKLSSLSFSYHDSAQTGQLLSRTVQDVERIRFLTGRAVLRMVEGTVLLLGTFLVLLWMNPRLAVLALGTMPVLGWVAYRFGRDYRPLSLELQQQLAVLTTRVEEDLRGARVVKAFAQEEAKIEGFERVNDNWFQLSARAARLRAFNIPLLELIASAGTMFIIWYGGSLVIRDQLTLGELVAFSTYLGQLFNPVRRMGVILTAFAMAAAAGERIFEILDAKSEVEDAPGAVPLPPIRGHVRFENVSFAYFGRHRVLDGVYFEALPGQIIALLGATGSGKSTIINLIPRFYEPSHGRILVDGHDTGQVTLHSLRDQIGIVLQETTLFAATIRENIAFGCPEASEEEIVAAARAAQAHEFILETPDGYDTKVGERGVTLSGGQKQRIAIARAVLKDPRILILDDATSSVDTGTEQLIQLALERLMEGRTSFVIAQRLSTVRAADLILVLEKGRVAASGTHAELLKQSGLYAEIYHRQLRPQEEQGNQAPGSSIGHGLRGTARSSTVSAAEPERKAGR